MGQDRVLLRLVEAVQLVHEKQRAPARPPRLLSLRDHLPEVGDSRGDGADLHEARAGGSGQDLGESRLAAARRPPEHDAGQAAGLGQAAQHGDDLLLADQVLKPPGAEARGKGGVGQPSRFLR